MDGLTIDSIVVDNVAVAGDTTDSAESNTVPIQIQVSADNVSTIKDMLVKFERSIRVIDIDNFVLEKGDTRYQVTIQAYYYQPAKEVTLTGQTIKPGSGNEKADTAMIVLIASVSVMASVCDCKSDHISQQTTRKRSAGEGDRKKSRLTLLILIQKCLIPKRSTQQSRPSLAVGSTSTVGVHHRGVDDR